MSLAKIAKALYKEKRQSVLGYIGLGSVAYLSPGVLFAFSAYLLSKSALKPGILTLGVAIGSVRLFAVARGASQYGERLVGHNLVLEYASKVRVGLFESLSTVVPHRLSAGVFADLMAALNGDVEEVQSLLLRLIGPFLSTLFAGIVAVVVAFSFSELFGLATLAVMVMMGGAVPVVFYLAHKKFSSQITSVRSMAYRSASSVSDTYSERRLIATQDPLVRRLKEETTLLGRLQVSQGFRQTAMASVEAFLETVALVATFTIGAVEVRDHNLGGVYVAVVPFLLLGTLEGLSSVAVEVARMVSAQTSIKRLNVMLSFEQRVFPKSAVTLTGCGRLDVSFCGVTFCYPQSRKTVVEGLSFHLGKGEHMLITGESGSGKSTIASLILGAWLPTSGEIYLNGVSTRLLSEDSIAEKIGYLGPDPYVFNATIEANLKIAAPSATSEELNDVLFKVGLKDWLESQPDGIRSKISMGSKSVSSGERQRIAISRVLLRNSRTLIVDEPTANLDAENERVVADLINELFVDATVIAITHSELFSYIFRSDVTLEL